MDAQPKQSKAPRLPVLAQHIQVPIFWVTDLMPLGKGISSSFWKYSLVLWKDVVGYGDKWEARKTMEQFRQFNINKAASCKWTAAYSMSGIFDVHYGKRHKIDQPGVPTHFVYHKDAQQVDWEAFIAGLSDQCTWDTDHGFSGVDDAYRGSLCRHIVVQRDKRGLKPTETHRQFLNHCKKEGIIAPDWEMVESSRKSSDRRAF